jgi:ribosomal protein S27AE
MGLEVAALTQQPADVGAATRASSLGPAPPAGKRRELRCPDCGYGAVVAHPLRRCPMCGGGDWQLINAFSGPDGAGAGRW